MDDDGGRSEPSGVGITQRAARRDITIALDKMAKALQITNDLWEKRQSFGRLCYMFVGHISNTKSKVSTVYISAVSTLPQPCRPH